MYRTFVLFIDTHMSNETKQRLLAETRRIFAMYGYEGLSMRTLAKDTGISPSVVYHHFADKDALLKEMFDYYGTDLGALRAQLPQTDDPVEMMRQRVRFQLDNAESVVAILKYYLHYRANFEGVDLGYVPETAYRHITEVLRFGVEKGVFEIASIEDDAKVITHAINGFVLEYYPAEISSDEKEALVNTISGFLLRSLMVSPQSGKD